MSRREGGFFMRETFFVFRGTKPTEERKPCILQADTPLTLSVASRRSQYGAKSVLPLFPPTGLALFFWNGPVYVQGQ